MAIIDRIDEILEDPEKINAETMPMIFHEILNLFGSLKAQLESKDKVVREEALDTIATLQTQIEEKMTSLCQLVGMDLKGFEAFISNPAHFNQDEWASIERTNSEIADFQKELKIIASSSALN